MIQIPCYNEAETLEIALNDLPKHIDGIDEIEQADGHEEHNSQKVGNDFLVFHISKE